MKLSWKLLPLAAVAVLGVAALLPGGGVKQASAEVDAISVSAQTVLSGQSVTASIDADQAAGVLTVTVTGLNSGTTRTLTLTDCDGCDDETDSGTSLSIDSAVAADFPADGNVVVTVTVSCTGEDSVNVNASQGGVSKTASVTCVTSLTPTVTPTVTGTPATATPTVTTTPGASTISLQAVPGSTTQCAQDIFLFATIRTAGVPVSGQAVTFTASGNAGTFSPASANSESSGIASSSYKSPSTGTTTVTITASWNGQSATASVPVNCAAAPAATATPAAVAQVRPPSTGEAGLAEDSNLTLYAGLAVLLGGAFTGALVVARRRA